MDFLSVEEKTEASEQPAGHGVEPFETRRGGGKRPAIFVGGLAALVLLSVLCVRPGVWMNLGGTLTAPFAVPTVVIHDLTYNPDNIETWVPLNIYEDVFRGAWNELISRKVMAGEDFQLPSPSLLVDYGVKQELIDICWYSLWSWASIILTAVWTSRLIKLREGTTPNAVIPIIGMWACFAVIPLICEITVIAFHFINASMTFVLAGCAATGIFMATREYTRQAAALAEWEAAQLGEAMWGEYRQSTPEHAWVEEPEAAREETESGVVLLMRLQAEEETKRVAPARPAPPERPGEKDAPV